MLLSGALPRELSDLLAVAILALASLEATRSGTALFTLAGSWSLILFVPLTSALAALSNSPRRHQEELALFAYGGAPWQIQCRHLLRGIIIVAIGLIPMISIQMIRMLDLTFIIVQAFPLALCGGAAYAIPGLVRANSTEFVEDYKG